LYKGVREEGRKRRRKEEKKRERDPAWHEGKQKS
jgi:hypothetical protein